MFPSSSVKLSLHYVNEELVQKDEAALANHLMKEHNMKEQQNIKGDIKTSELFNLNATHLLYSRTIPQTSIKLNKSGLIVW